MSDTVALDRGYLEQPEAPAAEPIHLDGFAEGVFFGMDEGRYHAVPALSASGIKRLLVSPMDFWAGSWMAPPLEDEDPQESAAKVIGKAYHARIVEGVDEFRARYAAKLDPADYPHALRTMEDIREPLRALGLKTSGNKDDLIDRLMEADPSAQVWDRLVADHAAKNDGRTLLTPRTVRRIEIAAAMIERHPQLQKCFAGGVPELSVFWHDSETGIPCKARFDYTKPKVIVDLKTHGNPYGKPIDRSVATAMASGRYHIQAAWYLGAAAHIASLAAAGRMYGEHDPAMLKAIAECPDHERRFVFVFQTSGVAPVARGYEFPRGLVYGVACTAIDEAKRRFLDCWHHFGPEVPWVENTPMTTFEDEAFPAWGAEI